LRILSRQRERWHRGLIAGMWRHKGMLFNPRYGRVGLVAMPFFTFGEMLAPLVEVLGYGITALGLTYGIVNTSFALLFLLVAWSSYEGVTNSEDWSTAGAQFTLAAARGSAGWVAGERVGRFGATDLTARVGGVLHPTERWWITAEAGTATDPEFMPKNSWEVDVAALVGRRASFGLGYRRRNYV